MSLQQRHRVCNNRAEPNGRRAAKFPLAHNRVDHPTELSVSLADPNPPPPSAAQTPSLHHPCHFRWMCVVCGENLERTHLCSRRCGAGKIGRAGNPCSKTQRKERSRAKGDEFRFPRADGTVNLTGGGQEVRTCIPTRNFPDQGEEHHDGSQKESDGSDPAEQQSTDDDDVSDDF